MIINKDDFNYKFDTLGCDNCEGNCCIGKSGYIWISKKEIKNLAKYKSSTIDKIIENDLNKINYKYSIKEIKIDENNFACKFFDLNKKKCSIYEVRPEQCRTFPFWDYFKKRKDEVKEECPAIVD
jgi:Fe-S-cluster containining protein